LGDW